MYILALSLLPEHLHGHVLVAVLLHDLGDRHLEVLLGDVDASLAQGEHARLRAHTFTLRTRRIVHLLCDLH